MTTATNTYELQTVNYLGGSVKFTLFSSVSGLTLPTWQTLTFDGEVAEVVDVQAGENNLQNVVFRFVEDYTAYSEGFWHKVLKGTATEIRTLINKNDGKGWQFLFWGVVIPQTIQEPEVSLLSGKIKRTGTFQTVSILSNLKTATIADLYASCVSNFTYVTANSFPGQYMNVAGMLSLIVSLIHSGTLWSVYVDNIDFRMCRYSGNPGQSYNTWAAMFSDLWFLAESPLGAGYKGLLQSDGLWPSKFSSVWDLLQSFCHTFGLIPVYRYDPATGTHQLRLKTRGHVGSAKSIGSGTKQSTPSSAISVVVNSLNASRVSGEDDSSRPPATSYLVAAVGGGLPAYTVGTPTTSMQFDMSTDVLFETSYSDQGNVDSLWMEADIAHDTRDIVPCGGVDVWDYVANAWCSDQSPVVSLLSMQHAIMYYLLKRFQPPSSSYARTVFGTDPTVSIMDLVIINDNVSAKNFYITELRQNPITDEMSYVCNETL